MLSCRTLAEVGVDGASAAWNFALSTFSTTLMPLARRSATAFARRRRCGRGCLDRFLRRIEERLLVRRRQLVPLRLVHQDHAGE
jgi:hypothetical protein